MAYLLKDSEYAELRKLLTWRRKISGGKGITVRNSDQGLVISAMTPYKRRQPQSSPPPVILAKITGVQNDYLVVKRVDSEGAVTGSNFNVAKPPELRHDHNIYDGLTGLTTDDAQTVEVTDGSITETWTVKPPYRVSGEASMILVARVPYSGVTVDDADLKYIDLNIAGRVWGLT